MGRAKKISSGHYVYRGFKVNCCGYAQGQMRWEAVDEHGCGFAHSNTFKGTKALIDWEFEKNKDMNNGKSN